MIAVRSVEKKGLEKYSLDIVKDEKGENMVERGARRIPRILPRNNEILVSSTFFFTGSLFSPDCTGVVYAARSGAVVNSIELSRALPIAKRAMPLITPS